MHPALRLANLSKLPDNYRTLAMAAARGSTQDLIQLCHEMSSLRTPELLFPTIYASLDPSSIPTLLEQLDSPLAGDPGFRERVRHPYVGLEMLLSLLHRDRFPVDALCDCWTRIWQWIEFGDTYHEPLQFEDPRGFYPTILGALTTFWDHKPTVQAIDTTPGVRAVIARAWALVLEDAGGERESQLPHKLLSIQRYFKLIEPRHFEEAITGLGGKGALAAVVMRHIRVVLDSPDTIHTVALLADSLSMLGYRCISDPSFRDAMFQEGVVHILPYVVYTLASPPFDDSGETLWNLCFSGSTHALLRYMLSGHECVAQCLSDGFLRALLECERRLHIDEVYDFVGNVFSLLSLSLVYYSVAVQLEIALNELGLRAVEDAFCGIPDLSIRWELFFTLAQQRLSLLNTYRDGHLSTTRACDNMECGVILIKSKLRRCAGCRTSLYCSVPCQINDWRAGCHRDACESLLSLQLSRSAHTSSRNKSFFIALLHDDYRHARATIALKIVQFLRRRPGTIPVIIFNYAEPLLEYKITVTVPTEKRGVPKDYLSRAERSNGRILLRVMKFMEGPNIHRWIFPLHMETSELLVGLQLIAQEDGDDLDETTARIEDLLDLDVEETL